MKQYIQKYNINNVNNNKKNHLPNIIITQLILVAMKNISLILIM